MIAGYGIMHPSAISLTCRDKEGGIVMTRRTREES